MPAWLKLPYTFGPDNAIAWDLAFPEFPTSSGGVWSMIEADPRWEQTMARAMAGLDSFVAVASVEDVPWGKFERFLDIGGSKGHFLMQLLGAHSSKKGILFDRPSVIDIAHDLWKDSEQRSMLEMVPGSFFEHETLPLAKDGDVWFLRGVLHNWSAERVRQILTNLHSAMKKAKGVTLMLGEYALPDHDKIAPPPSLYRMDLHMMVVDASAQERTPAQWKALLPQVGFEIVTIHATRSPFRWIEARPI